MKYFFPSSQNYNQIINLSQEMSRQTTVTKKPFCKVCCDVGKPESVYTSHWVRTLPDRNGKSVVTCPTLLETKCRFCSNTGHTTKFCPELQENKKVEERKTKDEVKTKPKVQEKKIVTTFAALMYDSDTEDEEPETHAVIIPQTSTLTGWAAIAAKPAAKPAETKKQIVVAKPQEKKTEVVSLADFVKEKKIKTSTLTGWTAIAAKPAEPKKQIVVAKPQEKKTEVVSLTDFVKVKTRIPAPWSKDKNVVVFKTWADCSDSEDDTW